MATSEQGNHGRVKQLWNNLTYIAYVATGSKWNTPQVINIFH